MALRHYFSISVGVFVLVILAARYVSIPILPFALVLLVGETVISLQLEDQKIIAVSGRFAVSLEIRRPAAVNAALCRIGYLGAPIARIFP